MWRLKGWWKKVGWAVKPLLRHFGGALWTVLGSNGLLTVALSHFLRLSPFEAVLFYVSIGFLLLAIVCTIVHFFTTRSQLQLQDRSQDSEFRVAVTNKGQPTRIRAEVVGVDLDAGMDTRTWLVPWRESMASGWRELKTKVESELVLAVDVRSTALAGGQAKFIGQDYKEVWDAIGGTVDGSTPIGINQTVRIWLRITRDEPYRNMDRWVLLWFEHGIGSSVRPRFALGDYVDPRDLGELVHQPIRPSRRWRSRYQVKR